MSKQLALVVDDSKTARITLKRMLEQQNLNVDTLESAPEALDYLGGNIPDVIFMDHMMPGMDGFEAVEAIKGNPDTATIPIMMYTSKEGDLYVSQARALGAVGILPKHVEPAELFEVLNSLGLAKDRRSKSTSRKSNVVLMDDSPEVALSAERDDIREIANEAAVAASNHEPATSHLGGLLENYHHEMVEQIKELRYVVDSLSARHTSFSGVNGLLLPLLVFLFMLVPLLWMFNLQQDSNRALETANLANTELLVSQQSRASESSDNVALQAQLDSHAASAREQSGMLTDSIAWGINHSSPYGMHEEAFNDRRLTIVQELLTRLTALGFIGTVQLESHLGEFCLSGNEVSGYRLAPGNILASDCTLVGHPLHQLPTLGERQSIGFANFLSTSPLVNNGDIQIELVNYRDNRPKLGYPPRYAGVTAQDWNRIAAANNRVEVTLIADSL